MKKADWINPIIYTAIILLFGTGCKKEEPPTIPVVFTTTVTGLTWSTAICGGNITSDGRSAIIIYGVCWSTNANPTINDSKTEYGSGTGPFTCNIDDLLGGTTYHVRAYATNSVGTAYGKDITFTTLGQAPTATTDSATNIFGTTATLNGVVNANYLSTIVTFEYGITKSYGSTVTAIQGEVTGNSSTNVSADISGLTSNTTYHFRVKTVNNLGTVYSDDRTFTTLLEVLAPFVSTESATNIFTTVATLNGTVNANDSSAIVTFEYGTTTSYGSAVTAFQSPVTGDSITNVSADISGLTPGMTYHFRVKAENNLGTVYGDDITFITLLGVQAPIVSTELATNVSATGTTLNGTVNAKGLSATVTFDYGTTTSYGQEVTPGQSPVTGHNTTSVSADISDLTPCTTFHFRIKAENSDGIVYGDDITFAALGQAATATTESATNISAAGATLKGIVNTNNLSATATFEYGTTTSYGQEVTPGQNPVMGDSITSVSADISGLTPDATYHFRVKAENSCGTVSGSDIEFKTNINRQIPTAITMAATTIYSTVATLNGAVNANGLSANVIFEYGTTTSYGSTIIPSQSQVTGNSNTNVSADITGLIQGTTYHFRVIAENADGAVYGSDIEFTTVTCSQFPLVTTLEPINTYGGATLNGTVNASDLSTKVTFTFQANKHSSRWVYFTVDAVPDSVTGNSIIHVSASITLGMIDRAAPMLGFPHQYWVSATNSCATVTGNVMSFIPLAGKAPTATTDSATNILGTTATLNGIVNANNLSTTVTFEYGTTTSYGNTSTASQNPVTGNGNTNVSADISGLTSKTGYHFRVKAESSRGTVYGDDVTFTTP